MLIDISFSSIDENTKQKIIEICGEYIDMTPKRKGRGKYYSHLNFTHLFDMSKSSFNEWPSFSVKNKSWLNHMKNRYDSLSNDDKSENNYLLNLIEDEDKKPEKVFNNKRKMKRLARKNDCSTHINSYGVVDSFDQLLSLYDFERDPRKFAIFLTPIFKENQEPEGGWRWSKWGPYYGTQKPQTEYLYDDPNIDLVFVFHIIEFFN